MDVFTIKNNKTTTKISHVQDEKTARNFLFNWILRLCGMASFIGGKLRCSQKFISERPEAYFYSIRNLRGRMLLKGAISLRRGCLSSPYWLSKSWRLSYGLSVPGGKKSKIYLLNTLRFTLIVNNLFRETMWTNRISTQKDIEISHC